MDSGYVVANGQKLYYEIHGEGEPLVMIQGLGGDVTTWAAQIPALQRHFKVIAFDNRDAGRSSEAAEPYIIPDTADDAAALMDSLGISQAHVVGASMGGMVAQGLVLDHPHKVRKLVLLSTAARWVRFQVHFIRLMRWIRERDPDNEVLPIAGVLNGMMSTEFLKNDAAVDEMIERGHFRPQFPQSLAAKSRQEDAVAQFNSLDRLGQIEAPTLVLAADQDMLVPVWCSQEVADAIPGARLQVLEGGGHGAIFEIPDKVNQAIIDFLKD